MADNMAAEMWSDDEGIMEVLEFESKQATSTSKQETSTSLLNCDTSSGLTIPEEFPFPFEPYGIQKELMSKIYEALERGKIGIFESPTGTGKSMSMICGALKWLLDYELKKEAEIKELLTAMDQNAQPKPKTNCGTNSTGKKSTEPDWITNYSDKRKEKEELEKVKKDRELILKKEKKLLDLKQNLQAPGRHQNVFGSGKRKMGLDDDPFTELISTADDDVRKGFEKEARQLDDDFLLNQMESSADREENVVDDEEEDCEQVYVTKSMCINPEVTRLKSLSLINDRCKELQKNSTSKKPASETSTKKRRGTSCPYYNPTRIRHLTDRALLQVKDIEDLVETGRKVKACPYYSARRAIPAAQLVVLPYNTLLHNSTRQASGIQLKGNIVIIDEAHNLLETISNIHSVEVHLSQFAQAKSQLIQYRDKYRSRLLPINLLHVNQLIDVVTQFIDYLATQSKQGAPNNISQLLTVNNFLSLTELDNLNFFVLLRFCEKSQISRKLSGFVEKLHQTKVPETAGTLSETSADVNSSTPSSMSNLLRRIKDSDSTATASGTNPPDTAGEKNGRTGECKVLSISLPSVVEETLTAQQTVLTAPFGTFLSWHIFVATHNILVGSDDPISISFSPSVVVMDNKDSSERGTPVDGARMNSPLYLIESLLQALTNSDSDGRVMISRATHKPSSGGEGNKSSIRYLLLNPAIYFSKIVEECRSVIIAGGTMQPISEFKDQLFQIGEVAPEKIIEFSCGHVISPNNLLPIALSQDAGGNVLDFTYQSRNTRRTLDSLCSVLVSISTCVPGGVVCFLPSYQYEGVVIDHLQKSGAYQTISAKKKIFKEPKKASMVDTILESYSKVIKTSGGAFLFSVVGGKMSEGINFSDDLGRCIVMVGLPYPNMYSPELKEKMNYLNKNMKAGPGGALPGQIHYENLCMKAVNQSIGRAIRHRNDYACMMLLDHRYQRDSIISKLPGWLRDHVRKTNSLPQAVNIIHQFFASHR